MRDVPPDATPVNDVLPPSNGDPMFGRSIECEFTFDESGLERVSRCTLVLERHVACPVRAKSFDVLSWHIRE